MTRRCPKAHRSSISSRIALSVWVLCLIGMSLLLSPTLDKARGEETAFEERRQQYTETVVDAANRLFVGCEDYCENDGVCLMHRNNLWALLEAERYPEIRRPMVWNMLIGTKRNVPAWDDLDAQIDDKCGFDVMGILEETKLGNPEDDDGNGEPDWYDTLDKTQGLGLSICADWQLVMRLLLQYPDRLTQEEKDDVLGYYIQHFVDNGLQPSNANQQIQAVVGYYLYSEYFDRNLMIRYGNPDWDDAYLSERWPEFEYGGRRYVHFETYPAYQLMKDYIQYLFDQLVTGDNWYLSEFDSDYTHAFVTALATLYDFAQDETIKTKARMILDLILLEFYMDFEYGHGAPYGRSAFGSGGIEEQLKRGGHWGLERDMACILFGICGEGSDLSICLKCCFPNLDVLVSTYRPSPIITDLIDRRDESQGYWQMHMEYNRELHQEGYGKASYLTRDYILGGSWYWGREWTLTVLEGDPPVVIYNRVEGENYATGKVPFFMYKNAAYSPHANETVITGDTAAIDRDETSGDWRFLEIGNVMVAVGTRAVEVAQKGIDYQDYGTFKQAVLKNARFEGDCFVTSKGNRLGGGTHGGTWNGKNIWGEIFQPFPFDRMETQSSLGKLIDWNNNVMTLSHHGRTAVYDFNTWTISGDTGSTDGGSNDGSGDEGDSSGTTGDSGTGDDGSSGSGDDSGSGSDGDDAQPPPASNQVPVAHDGSLTTSEDTPASGTLGASDADGDGLVYMILTNGSMGTALLEDATTGSFTYTPQSGATGTDGFTFKVNDGQADSNTATLTVTITADNNVESGALVISHLSAANGKGYRVVDQGLRNGAVCYVDRDYTYSEVPSCLEGSTYIMTANDDKDSQGSDFLRFDVNQDVTVYVAHDDRYTTKPDWMGSFADTGEGIMTDKPFSLFRKDFSAGTIVLGGNAPAVIGKSSMYTVIVVPRRAGDGPQDSGYSDSDSDGMPDGWEQDHGLDPQDPLDANLDRDADGFTSFAEYQGGTDPNDAKDHPNLVTAGLGASSAGWGEAFYGDYSKRDWLRVDWSAYNAGSGETRMVTGDIDGDGRDEIILGLAPVNGDGGVPGGWFQLLDDDETPLGWGRVSWSAYNNANGETWPACGDVDGDGRDEIVVGLGSGGSGWVEILDYDSGRIAHQAWVQVTWTAYAEASGETRPACGDIDGDGRDEIVVGLGSPGQGWLALFDDALSGFDPLKWLKVQWSGYNSANGETRPACGDVDGDGLDEIIAGLGPGGVGWLEVFDYGSGGASHKDWVRVNWSSYNGTSGETRPVCGDVDGDGRDEIVVGLSRGGSGYMEVLDDASASHKHLAWPRIHWAAYNQANGETWPVVKK